MGAPMKLSNEHYSVGIARAPYRCRLFCSCETAVYCGVVHFTDEEEEDLLFVVGGYGPTPSSRQRGAQYKQANWGLCVYQ